MSPSSMMISPTLMPMRNSIRRSSATSALRSAIARWISMAQRTASTALANSTSAPSPVVLTIRPRCSAILGSTSSRLYALSAARVPSSSTPMRRLYPATSAARMAASRRSTRASAIKIAPTQCGFQLSLWSGVGCVYQGNDVQDGSNDAYPYSVRADFCPLCTQKRTNAGAAGLSAMCHKRTHAVQQTASLLDHLVGAGKQCSGDGEAKRLGGLKIDDQLKLRRKLHRQIRRLRAL